MRQQFEKRYWRHRRANKSNDFISQCDSCGFSVVACLCLCCLIKTFIVVLDIFEWINFAASLFYKSFHLLCDKQMFVIRIKGFVFPPQLQSGSSYVCIALSKTWQCGTFIIVGIFRQSYSRISPLSNDLPFSGEINHFLAILATVKQPFLVKQITFQYELQQKVSSTALSNKLFSLVKHLFACVLSNKVKVTHWWNSTLFFHSVKPVSCSALKWQLSRYKEDPLSKYVISTYNPMSII